MRTIVVGGRQVEMPAPIYIIPDTVKVSEETGTLSRNVRSVELCPHLGAKEGLG